MSCFIYLSIHSLYIYSHLSNYPSILLSIYPFICAIHPSIYLLFHSLIEYSDEGNAVSRNGILMEDKVVGKNIYFQDG